ncbi:thiamine pyrophosphate-binding protein [Saccharomonospora glauca]|uniref:Thiamine pyrophosphate-dependent enzyme, possible carboligase or decarboxylase n=1 Tax=Saccharomonospora glauca K62 TaxID=928724 RepID=I1CYP2_9PSEU|nr:thiamine pyrophosphate-binding protein [Saccharomonospora glauca]EIE97816.1 thiamine pyrophosphate-dependent enzyme, possible carboligase or decarboxylase [Saccharomonospora glauca K62]
MKAVWRQLAGMFADAGVTHVFGLPADEPELLDAARAEPRLSAVVVRDQRAAALAAIGHAQVSGGPAVLALTPGPAFTNSLTGLLEASSLGVPMIVVTSSTNPAEAARGGFQVTPQEQLVSPLVSWYHKLGEPTQVGWAVRRALHLSLNQRPGVTVIEVDHHLAAAEDVERVSPPEPLTCVPDDHTIRRAVALLSRSERPLILAGGGSRGAGEQIVACARRWGAMVLTTAAGRGVIDETHPASLGNAGLYASRETADVVARADALLVVGSALEETVRMGWPRLRCLPVVQIDRDPSAFGRAVRPEVAVWGDAGKTLRLLLDHGGVGERPYWASCEIPPRRESLAATTLRTIWSTLGRDAVLVQENGLHDMWSFDRSAIAVRQGTPVVTPGEQTTMGFGVPAAIGAATAAPGRDLLVVCGDSACEISITALPTLLHVHPSPVVVMLSNRGWGWPRAGREEKQRDLTVVHDPLPIRDIARSLGMTVVTVRAEGDLDEVVGTRRVEPRKPLLVVVEVDDHDVSPGVHRELAG